MAIKNGQVASATEVNSVVLRSALLSLANQHKVKHDDTRVFGDVGGAYLDSLAGTDYLVDGMANDQFMDAATTCVIDNEDEIDMLKASTQWVGYRAYICKTLDSFNDSSLDAGIWSNSGGGEDTEKYTMTANTNYIISDGASGLDLKALAGNSEVVFHVNIANGGSTTAQCQISNGSTHVDIHQRGNSVTAQDTIKVKIDKAGQNAYVSVNGGAFGGATDISSVTTNWYLRFYAGTSSSITFSIYFVGYIDLDGSTVDYVSADKTMDATKTSGVLTWDTNSPETIVGNLSSNGGSNYSTATKDTWTTIGTTSTTGKVKLTMTTPTAIVATNSTDYIYEVKAIGAYFDG